MRRILIALPIVLLASSAFADPTSISTPSTPVGEPHNQLALQLGFMPGFTELGLAYTRVVTPHFELSGELGAGQSISFGDAPADSNQSGAVLARLRAQHAGLIFSIGAGAGAFHSGDYTYADLIADAVIGYETENHLLFQLRGGAFGYRDRDDMNTTTDIAPFANLGLGFKF
jgi:hypothetical protein